MTFVHERIDPDQQYPLRNEVTVHFQHRTSLGKGLGTAAHGFFQSEGKPMLTLLKLPTLAAAVTAAAIYMASPAPAITLPITGHPGMAELASKSILQVGRRHHRSFYRHRSYGNHYGR